MGGNLVLQSIYLPTVRHLIAVHLTHPTNTSLLPELPQVLPPPQYTSPNFYHQNKINPRKDTPNSPRFTLEAKADLWALVQDDKGIELDWLKMKSGDIRHLNHQGALTITCSSGDLLVIKDKEEKVIETNPNINGISIVRLPAN